MNPQYQVVVRWVEGHYAPLYPPIPSLEEAVKLRDTYTRECGRENLFIVEITSRVMSENDINGIRLACEIDNGEKLFYVDPNGSDVMFAMDAGYSVREVQLGGACVWSNVNANAHGWNTSKHQKMWVTVDGELPNLSRVATARERDEFLLELRYPREEK